VISAQIATKMEELPKQMGSEDFAEITQRVPSVFMGIGAGGEDPIYFQGASHHPKVVWNEDVIPLGVAVHAGCAANWLLKHCSE
jgi:metal-dependent amidase/aminoacylase/carboxypeptidase family protein